MKMHYQCLGCGAVFSKEMPKREHFVSEEYHDCSGSRIGCRYRAVMVKITEKEEKHIKFAEKMRQEIFARNRPVCVK